MIKFNPFFKNIIESNSNSQINICLIGYDIYENMFCEVEQDFLKFNNVHINIIKKKSPCNLVDLEHKYDLLNKQFCLTKNDCMMLNDTDIIIIIDPAYNQSKEYFSRFDSLVYYVNDIYIY